MMNVDDNYDFNWDDPDVGSEPTQTEEGESTEIEETRGQAPEEAFSFGDEPEPPPEEEQQEEEEEGPYNIDEDEPPSEEPGAEEEYAEEPEESEPSDIDYNTFVEDFVEDQKRRGIFDEDEEITAENLNEKYVEAIERDRERSIEQFADNLSDVTQRLLEYEMNGGDPQDFLQTYAQPEPDFNMEEEQDQEDFARWWLTEKEGDPEEVAEAQIDALLEKGNLDKFAEVRYKKWQQEKQQRKEQREKRQQEAAKRKEQQEEQMRQQITDSISQLDEVKGFDVSDKEKREVIEFITKPTHRTENGFQTGFVKQMSNIWNNPEALYIVGKLAKDGFDLSSIRRQAETEVTKQVEDKVRSRAKNVQPKSSKSPRESKGFLVEKMK